MTPKYFAASLSKSVLVTILTLLLAGCQAGADDEEAEKETAEEPAIPVESTTVDLGSVAAAYEGTATLEADEEATVVTKTTGVVLEIMAEEGDRVEAGQIIARLEQDRYRLEVNRMDADLKRLQNEFKRKEELYQRQLVSTDEYDRARFDLESQKATRALAHLDLYHTSVRAPISGYISERMVKVGNLVTQHQPVFKIDNFSPLLAILHVPERELSIMRLGQPVEVRLDAYPGEVFVGEVTRLSPVVNPDTGTFRVTAELVDDSNRLKSGLFGRVSLVYDQHQNVPVVARDAVVNEDGATHVFVIGEDQTVTRQAVTLGFEEEAMVEVVEGLEPGDQVVTAGKGNLRDGAKVEVIGS